MLAALWRKCLFQRISIAEQVSMADEVGPGAQEMARNRIRSKGVGLSGFS
jgi:hypothetical protein